MFLWDQNVNLVTVVLALMFCFLLSEFHFRWMLVVPELL